MHHTQRTCLSEPLGPILQISKKIFLPARNGSHYPAHKYETMKPDTAEPGALNWYGYLPSLPTTQSSVRVRLTASEG